MSHPSILVPKGLEGGALHPPSDTSLIIPANAPALSIKSGDDSFTSFQMRAKQEEVSSGPDLMQRQRYERKYLITDPAKAHRIKEEILMCNYLYFDKFTEKSKGQLGYIVTSLYLDSSDKLTYWQTIQGDPERLKLRIRFYGNEPTDPCFFEIKRRKEGQRILKSRAQVTKAAAEAFLKDPYLHPITEEFLPVHLRNDKTHLSGLFAFKKLCMMIDARPASYTSYRRLGLEGRDDNSLRVTLDSDLRSAPYNPQEGLTAAGRESWLITPFRDEVTPATVCLELKYTNEHPGWMSGLVRNYNLPLESCQKYVRSQNLVNPNRCWL